MGARGWARAAGGVLLWGLCLAAAEERLWWDGTRESDAPPPGRLLSDNAGFYGDSVLTGVEYRYETQPDNPPDCWRDQKDQFGRRLLDGIPAGNWWAPVGVKPGVPLTVVFDFRRPCLFGELDVCTRTRKVAIRAEAGDSPDGPWRPAVERPLAECPDRPFHRVALAPDTRGRFLRVAIQGEGITYVEEVLVWGDAEISPETPEAVRPVAPAPVLTGVAFASVPGIEKTALSDAQFWDWQRALGETARRPAVWSRLPAWDSLTERPILPGPEEVNRPVEFLQARNETECAALALTNTSMNDSRRVAVGLSPFRSADGGEAPGITGSLRVGGAIASRHFGVNIGPLFEAGNMLPPGLMQRYLTNGGAIAAYPEITLTPAGSAILWLSVTTSGTPPGTYTAALTCTGLPPLEVRVRVADVVLPDTLVWLNTWSGTTSMFPFVYADRVSREVDYKQSLGVTVWNGWPEPGTPGDLARRRGRALYQIWGIGDYGHRLYAGQIDPARLTAEDEQKIAEILRGHAAKAAELGLTYEDWYVELTDEPGKGNAAAYGALCRIIRKADPHVRIYCNPCFWVGDGVLGDAEVAEVLAPWYRETVDVSVPLYLLLRDRPACYALFDAPRFVRAFYTVSTHSAKSERAAQVEMYRRQAWDAAAKGWNGWGFYSYYGPRGDPWNDFDKDWYTAENMPDYLMVYPGPRGPVPTRPSEAVREGWEDYRLLAWLREHDPDRARTALEEYGRGAAPAELHRRILEDLIRK